MLRLYITYRLDLYSLISSNPKSELLGDPEPPLVALTKTGSPY
jgi:hypothetical protein